MARGNPRVLAGTLTIVDAEGAPEGIAVGSAAWYAWLADDAHDGFIFVGPAGTFSARKERRQRGGVYWTAHRRRAGKLRKAYLGKSEDMTAQRLETIATQLAAEGRKEGDASRVVPPTPAADLLTTKLHVPRPRHGRVARPRLIDRLSRALAGPLTVVAAPAGFGKTTLLAAWIRETGRRVAWVSLDSQDADPNRFWTYVVAALQTLDPRVGADALGLLRAPQPASLQAVLVALINAIAASPDPFVLVLDDYHLVDRPPISETLDFLVDHLPEPLHLVLVARSDPHLPLARWRADGRLQELRAADLRFTPDEAADFLNREMGLSLAAEELATLDERTEGWIAGLQLAALSLRTSGDRPGFVAGFGGSHRFVLDYLTEQVLQGQPARVQDFLRSTAILDRMCAPLCDALTGDADGQATLEHLERHNLFVVPLDDERRWYRYHHLFAEVLRHRLTPSIPEGTAELHRRASAWHEAAGYPDDAIRHALAAADLAGAARLIERNVDAAWMRGEIATAEGWLAALPEETVRARPRLLAARVWLRYLVQQRHAEAREELGRLAEALAGTPSAAPATEGPADSRVADELRELRGIVAAMRTAVEGAGGPADVPIAYGREALANLTDGHPHWRTVAGAVLGRAYTVAGDLPAASRALDAAIERGPRSGTDYVVLVALDYLALVRVAEGRLRAAFELYTRAWDLARDRGGTQWPHVGYVENGLARLLYEWDDLEAARERFEAAIRVGRLHAHGPVLVSAYTGLAWLCQAQGDAAEAVELLRQAEVVARSARTAGAGRRVGASQARVWLAQGDVERAGRWLVEADLPLDATPGYAREREQLTGARVLLAQGRADGALALLEGLRQRAEAEGRLGSLIEILALQALARGALGDRAAAVGLLERALVLAGPAGYVRTFVDEGPALAALLAEAGTSSVEDAYLARVRASFARPWRRPASGERRGPISPPARSAPRLVEPLTDREREVLALIAAGESNREIADRLVVSVGTVKKHGNNIFGKLGVGSRTQAIARARALGLL